LSRPTKPTTPEAEMHFFADYDMKLLAQCEYFTVYHFDLMKTCNLKADKDTFHCILVLEGSLTLCYEEGKMVLNKGESVFIPAGLGEYSLQGKGEFILSMV
jgi:mannose-6-phosphate isomerase